MRVVPGLHVKFLEALVGLHVELELSLGHGVPLEAVAGIEVDSVSWSSGST